MASAHGFTVNYSFDGLTAISDVTGNLVESLSYDPWGRRRNADDWNDYNVTSTMFDRGFTGHEHLPQFGLINMNGRVYDPFLARFLSPDPFVQAPDNNQNFNRYSYCLNNPLKYIDPDGEFWHIVAGAVVGGVANLVMNKDNIDGFWEGVIAFGVGAAAGAATAASGGASGVGFWATTGIASATSAVTAGTNNVIAQTGRNFSGMNSVDWRQVGFNSAVGGVSGLAGSAAGHWAANSSTLINGINSPILRSVVVSPIAATTGHIAGGTTAGILEGQSFNKALESSFRGIDKSVLLGTAIGISSTVGVSFAKGMNPLNGKMFWPKNNGFNGSIEHSLLGKGTTFDRYGDESGRFGAPVGTSFDARSLPPNAKLSPLSTYKVVIPFEAYQGISSRSFWFSSTGGGTQYMFDQNISYLLQNGYIVKVP